MRINQICSNQISTQNYVRQKNISQKNVNTNFKGAWYPGMAENIASATTTAGMSTFGALCTIGAALASILALAHAADKQMQNMSKQDYDDQIDMMAYRDMMYG